MLVLTRKPGQGLLIGDDIIVHLIRDEGGEIRLGIDAPRNVNVARLELLKKQPRKQAPRAGR